MYFAVYKGTVEEMIRDLMGKKMFSNQLLTGQEVSGALVPEDASSVIPENAEPVWIDWIET